MARDFYINGETLVKVKTRTVASGNEDVEESLIGSNLFELGLTDGLIRITPTFKRKDIYVDDYGPGVPAETMTLMAEASVEMTLIQFDQDILDLVIGESTGGSLAGSFQQGAGVLMGNDAELFDEDCYYVSLNLLSPVESKPWRFPTCYLADRPFMFPLGTEKSAVQLTWRAVPYRPMDDGDVLSSEAVFLDP